MLNVLDVKIDSVTLYFLHSDEQQHCKHRSNLYVEPRRTHPIQIISKQIKGEVSQNVFSESSVEQLNAGFYKQ